MNLKLLNFPENITSDIKENLNLVLNSGFWSTGPESKNLEDNFFKFYRRECISTSSGGTALQLLHDSFKNIKRIAIQSNTYFATALPWINSNSEILLLGARNDSLMPSFEIVKASIEKNPDAIIITHIGGYPNPEIKEIAEICKEKDILLFEDCAHSPLVKIDGKYVGTFGDAAILSFFPTKPIPAGEGGMIIVKNSAKAFEIRKIRDYGKFIDKKGLTKHYLPAFPNARLNEYSATIANTVLKHYFELLSLKIKIANFYDSNIDNNLIFSKIYNKKTITQFSYYKYICFLKDSKFKTAQVYDYPNQLVSILNDNNLSYEFFGEEEYSRCHTCLPITYSMTIKDAEEILNNVTL